jgi:integrase
VDRKFPEPIGEIRIASGTHDPQAFRDINDMLTALCRSVPPRWDVLMAIKARRIAPLHALSLYRMNRLEEVPSAELLPQLEPTWRDWLAGKEYSREYRASIGSTLGALLRLAPAPTLGQLPVLLREYRDECKREAKPVQFNRAKAHVQAFVRDTLRKRHEVYRDVTDVDTLPVEAPTVRRPQKPAALRELLASLPEPHRRMAWSMAVTGMGPKEYWGGWELHRLPARIHVEGTKRDSRRRDVPLWASVVPPERSRSAFEGAWDRHIGPRLGIYDLRRSFAVWMEDAGIPRSRRKLYLGHSAGDVTGLYERRELLAWLEEDAARLRAYAGSIAEIAGQPLTLVVA